MKGAKIPDDFFKDKIDYCGLEDNIYNQLAKTMARNVDIDFAKTPVVDILTGYTRYIEAEKRVEQLENTIKEATDFVNENIKEDYYDILDEYITHFIWNTEKEDLLNILNKESEDK